MSAPAAQGWIHATTELGSIANHAIVFNDWNGVDMTPPRAEGEAGAQPAPKQSDFRWNLVAGIALLVAGVATWLTGQPAIAVVFACSGLVFLMLARGQSAGAEPEIRV